MVVVVVAEPDSHPDSSSVLQGEQALGSGLIGVGNVRGVVPMEVGACGEVRSRETSEGCESKSPGLSGSAGSAASAGDGEIRFVGGREGDGDGGYARDRGREVDVVEVEDCGAGGEGKCGSRFASASCSVEAVFADESDSGEPT